MNQRIPATLFLAAALIVFNGAAAQEKPTEPVERDTAKTVQLTAPARPKTGPKPYKEVITDKALTRKGLIVVHRVENSWFFEVGDSLLSRDILVVNRIAKGAAGVRSGNIGYAGDQINENVVRFEKGPNDRLFLRNISYDVYARDTTADMYQAVQNSNVQPIVAAFDIKAYSPDSTGSVVDVTAFLDGDSDVFFFAPRIKSGLKLGGLQKDRSFILDIRTYPINTEIRTVKTYTLSSGSSSSSSTPGAPRPPASGTATYELNSSMVLLPANPMRPRYYDDRVAYFTTGFTDFDADPQGVKNISMITRWRLEPKPQDLAKYKRGELVEPARPIVFYIDPATPKKWVPYLIQGVNDWQKAFEKAGFKNAIYAREAPTREEDSTWSLEDARFSAIVYKPSDIPNANGPHVHDPRTGEILESHINWYHNVMSLLYRWYLIQASPSDPRARKPRFDDELMGQLVRFVSAHEVGHTLGLPHNMGASSATPVEKLRDRKWLEKNGHTASIMDYARFNYVAQPEDKIPPSALMPRINDYDIWAIEWGYRLFPGKTEEEEKKILNEWVRKQSANPRLRFIHANGADPRAQVEDLGDNAMKAGAYGIANLKRILPQLPAWLAEEGEKHEKLEKIYAELVAQFNRYMGHATMNIGGIYTDRKTSDQPGPAHRVVPRETQKQALAFVSEHGLQTPYWLLNAEVLGLFSAPTSDPVSNLQQTLLNNLLNDARLQRLIASYNRDSSAYSPEEYFSDLQEAIWSELPQRKSIDNYRRNLQKAYVEKLGSLARLGRGSSGGGGITITISIGPVVDLSKSDVVSLAKASLRKLAARIAAALETYPEGPTRYHLEDVADRIERALKPD